MGADEHCGAYLNPQLEELWYFTESNKACHLMLLSSGERMNSASHRDKN